MRFWNFGIWNYIEKNMIDEIEKQKKKKEELLKKNKNIKIVKTTELVHGKTYRPILHENKNDEFIFDERILSTPDGITKNKVSDVGGDLYTVKTKNWLITLDFFANELFVLVEENSKNEGDNVKTPKNKGDNVKTPKHRGGRLKKRRTKRLFRRK